MYPVVRIMKELALTARAAPLGIWETHVSHHICWPWDLDIWMELNNGRALTLFDLGRIPLAGRVGLISVLKRERWALTVAGSSVRYRARVRMFDRLEMRSRAIGHDGRFIYLEQSMWRGETCTTHVLIRSAVTSPDGIVPPERVFDALGLEPVSPELPDWVKAWSAADATRPWPPQR